MAERLTFAEKPASATNEDKQVNPIYVNAISANLPKLGGGMDADNPSYNLYTDGVAVILALGLFVSSFAGAVFIVMAIIQKCITKKAAAVLDPDELQP